MYLSTITIENFRCFGAGDYRFELRLRPGLTALVGENEAGKSAVIDALRFVLGTKDQEWRPLEDTDFCGGDLSKEIRIVCEFKGLGAAEKRALIEYLTYGERDADEPVLYIHWTAKDTREAGRSLRRPDIRSGKNGDGPSLAPEVRELLRATYLRPLRDAEQALSAGRFSRLAQVLYHTQEIKSVGSPYDPSIDIDRSVLESLNVLGIGDLANDLLGRQQGVGDTRNKINSSLVGLSLQGDNLKSDIKVSGSRQSEPIRLRQLLEKLDLGLDSLGKAGMGSNNLLFMACELLLLAQEDDDNKLLMIEEPEAHLMPQRQLRVMKFMQEEAQAKGIQILVTTHSPNLASAISLNNIVMLRKSRAFPMAEGDTELETSDYRFLERFLDATKANLFFARGVLIVEGDAENILFPTLARLIERDFTKHGVSIVNVGGTGLRRYARIFQRKNAPPILDIPVACVTDMDVMPNCAPVLVGKLRDEEEWPPTARRKWRAKRDFANEESLKVYRAEKSAKADGQSVQTFIADEWTLEYDLALGPKAQDGTFANGLAEDVFVAASLAASDDEINSKRIELNSVVDRALQQFTELRASAAATEDCVVNQVIATEIYAKFAREGVSKAIAAQYLAERLQTKHQLGVLGSDELRRLLPRYITNAIDYVTTPLDDVTRDTHPDRVAAPTDD